MPEHRIATLQKMAASEFHKIFDDDIEGEGFEYFLFNHVYIRDVKEDGSSQKLRWEHWPVHDELIADTLREKRLIYVKARQLGFSWFYAARMVYRAITEMQFEGGVISAGADEAAKFLAKCRFIWENLPYRPILSTDNTEQMVIESTHSVIRTFPSTAKAGIGDSYNLMVVDEAAFHPFAEQNYAAYEPAVEHGQLVLISSAGGEESTKQITNDWFERKFNEAPENGFYAKFYPWNTRRVRDAEWYMERERRLGREAMKKQYPSNVEEAFASMLNPRFDMEGLDYIKERLRDPRSAVTLPEGITSQYLKVWETPHPNTPYIIYTDPADGVGRDYTTTTIAEAKTLNIVARFRENRLEPEVHGAKARLLAVWYNTAYASWERAKGEGIAMAFAGYSRIHYWEAEQTLQQKRLGLEGQKRPGIPVTEDSRTDLISGLALAIETGQLNDPDTDAHEELRYFVKVEHKLADGRIRYRDQAAAGKHDDIVMCLCGIVALSKVPAASRMRVTGEQLAPVEMAYGF